jgi:hypothetical protein
MHTQIESSKTRSLMNWMFVLLAVAGLVLVSACEEPTTAEKMENAADEMGDGMENAAEEMQDRSTGEKIGDAVEDAGEEIQDAAE